MERIREVLAEIAPDTPMTRQRLVSTYFETPDLALREAGTTLRVRERDGRFVQTVKTAAPLQANLLSRGEWEDLVARNEPDLTAPHTGPLLPERVAGRLCPLFVTEVVRETVELEPSPGTCVEVAIDTGEIRAAVPTGWGPAEPISEIELELKDGDPEAIFDLALKLLETAPLRIQPGSKSERGYRLVGRAPRPAAVRTAAIALDPDMSIDQVLQTIGRSCLAHLLLNEPAALAGEADAVHQMRVALRRLRSGLAMVKKELPRDPRRAIADQLAMLAAPLGPARNLDVFATELLEPLRHERAGREAGWDDLAAAAERARAVAYDRVRAEILSPQHTVTMLRLMRWFEGCGWQAADVPQSERLRQPIGSLVPAIFDRRRRKVKQRARHFSSLTPKERHRLRIAVKKLRYSVELLRSLCPKREAGRLLELLKPVQDELGHANDIRVAYGRVIELGRLAERTEPIAAAGGELLELHERALLRRDPKLKKRLRRLIRAEPFWRS